MSTIDKAYADMFNPYSEVWEVSGTSAPTWTWMVSKGADGGVVVGDTYTTMDTKDENGKVVSKDFYDIRTDRLYAPFSIFARHMLMDYMGMLGVMRVCDETVLTKNFDTGLARGGVMWSNAEPTYKNIIDAFENIKAGRYKIQDFIYNKYYKRYAARVRVHQLKEDEFNKWRYQAITKRDECYDGKITPEEYVEWMEAYFPNRKRKSE